MTSSAIIAAVIVDVLPVLSLAAVLPSLLLVKPLRWAYTQPNEPVPIPALGANVVWILTTNFILAVSLGGSLVL